MADKQIIIDENKINPNDWLEPYKPIPACEIKDCDHLVYAGNNVYGCRIAEDGLVCDDFNNDDECCMYRQLEYYKEALKHKEQECEELKDKNKRLTILGMNLNQSNEVLRKSFFATDKSRDNWREKAEKLKRTLTEIKEIAENAAKCMYATYSDDYTDGYRWLGSIILQKISECEVVE